MRKRPARRQHVVELFQGPGRETHYFQPFLLTDFAGHHSEAAAHGEDGDAVAPGEGLAEEGQHRVAELFLVLGADDAGLTKGGGIDGIDTGQGPGMRPSRPSRAAGGPGLHGDDGLLQGNLFGQVEKAASLAQPLDVERDDARILILRQIL